MIPALLIVLRVHGPQSPSLQTRETLSVAVSCEMHGELESEGIAVRCELESSLHGCVGCRERGEGRRAWCRCGESGNLESGTLAGEADCRSFPIPWS